MFWFYTNPKLVYDWIMDDVKYNLWWGPIVFIKDIPRHIRWWWQRRTRGWDDRDLWSMDYTIAKFVLPRLKKFREVQIGHPAHMQEIEWKIALDEMIEAFKMIELDCCSNDPEYNSKIDRGLYLFYKHFRDLWD
jgi:hypothetical protein